MALGWWARLWGQDQKTTGGPVPGGREAPGPSRGLFGWARDFFGGWGSPRDEQRTDAGQQLEREVAHSGPANVILPWFPPYIDLSYTGETMQHRRSYRLMLSDPNIKAALYNKILSVGALDLQIQPAKAKRPLDLEVADFVRWNLTRRLQGGVPGLAWTVLSGGLTDGYSVSEKVMGYQDRGVHEGKWALRQLKAKDVDNDLVLQTDSYRNVVGVLGIRYNAGVQYPPSRFLIFRNLALYDTPTGQSELRAAYRPWWLLTTATSLRGIAVEKRATGYLVGTFKHPSTRAKLEQMLADAKSTNWASVPEGDKIEVLNLALEGDSIFKSACDDWREEIFLAIQHATLQALTGGQGEHRGSSKVHAGQADTARWALCAALEALLNDEDAGLIRDLVDLNYAGIDDYPVANFAAVEPDEMKTELDIDKVLNEMIDLSKEEMYDKYGRTPPSTPEDTIKAKAAAPPGMPGMPGMPGAPPGANGENGEGGDKPPPFGGNGKPPGSNGSSPKPAAFAEEEDDEEEEDPEERAGLIADILGGLLGRHALKAFSEDFGEWNKMQHPRGPGGRFIKRGSAEAVATAHSALDKLHQGEPSRAAVRQAVEHLGILTVKQLRAYQQKHGLKAAGKLRWELLDQIAERLPGHGRKKSGEVTDEDLGRKGGGGAGARLPAGQPVGADAAPYPMPGAARITRGVGAGRDQLSPGADGGGAGPAGAADSWGNPARDGAVGGPGAAPGEQSLAAPPTPDNPTDTAAPDWRYEDRDFAGGGLKAKFKRNIEAIQTLRAIRAEGRDVATPAEQAVLSKYIGWGQFPGLFGYYGGEWEEEQKVLKSLISDEDYEAARASTINAHFTHPDVVDAHWRMAQKLGFKGGRFLETSAGIGYYLGMMPEALAGKVKSSAAELDPQTAAMLKLLYPGANVKNQGFQDFRAPDGFYDLVASNVPFAKEGPFDKTPEGARYNKLRPSLHDYFFLKSMDKVRPGGLLMHITSTGTLDRADPKVRQELAKQGDLVAALRFPGGAHKENAGTDVVTDLLIFRKRPAGEAPVDPNVTPPEAEPGRPGFTGTTTDSLGRLYHWVNGKRVPGPDWLETTTVPDPAGGEPIPVNRYFAEHPEQVLGTLDRTGSMYQGNSVNVSKTDDYEERLEAAVARLPEGVMKPAAAGKAAFVPEAQPAPGDVKEGGYTVQGGKLYIREGGAIVAQDVPPAVLARVQAILDVRDARRTAINDELAGRDAADSRKALGAAYDAFVAKYGILHDKKNLRVFHTDPDLPVVLSLEHYDAKSKKATKADIFDMDVVRHVPKVEHAGSPVEALAVSLHETGGVDLARMAALVGKSAEDVAAALTRAGLAYQDPQEGWKPADQYLSGNVRKKLVTARAAAEADPRYTANVTALEKVQPGDVEHSDIEARMGASWIPPRDVAAFCGELLGADASNFKIGYVPSTGTWLAHASKHGAAMLARSLIAKEELGTERVDFLQVLTSALNNKSLSVYDSDPDGKKVLNKDATDAANAKVQDLKDRFKGWLWEDDERRERLARFYNDNFNNIRDIHYDGSHQSFPGMNPAIALKPHQKDFIWQVVCTGRGLAAHEVGTGKTFSMIAAAMELRRLGLARKPAIACLKSNVEAITADAMLLYPGARILSTADMFDAKSRKRTIAKIATGDYDLIILTHDHLNLLQMKPETVAAYIREELGDLEAARVAAEKEGGKDKGNRVVKALEHAKAKLEAKLEEALDPAKKDNAVNFEETGIDQLFVDEAHKYKTLPVYTKQDRVKGVPSGRSQRATAMQMRTRWLQENNSGRGVVFATGTPVANTMAELYTMQRYLQPEVLKERGLSAFDAWASNFGDMETKTEFTVAGEYKPVTRFARFVNLPELMQMARGVMDVQRAEDMPDMVRPKRHDEIITTPKSEAMTNLMASLQARAKSIKGPAKKGEDNMLKICTDGRKGAIDMRLLDASAPDDPNSKTNQCVRKVLELHAQHPGMTQAIFSDIGVNPMKGAGGKADAADVDEEGEEQSDQGRGMSAEAAALSGSNTSFRLYGDIIDKLVKGGIPREKIADFSQLKGAAKEAAQEAMRQGDILVALGSTEKLGTGVNVQKRLRALHHIDVPWLPASIEQREGRGWRQGNLNKDIDIYKYVSEGSLDQTFWQIVGNKARFIKQVITPGKTTARVVRDEDTEELTPDQLMAAASGDVRILQKVNLEADVRQLESAHTRHERDQARLQRAITQGERKLPQLQHEAEQLSAAAQHLAAHPDFGAEIGGTHHTDRKEAAAAFEARAAEADARASAVIAETPRWRRGDEMDPEEEIANYRGLSVVRRGATGAGKFVLRLPDGHEVETGASLGSVEAVARRLPQLAQEAAKVAAKHEKDLEAIRAGVGKKFPKKADLEAKRTALRDLERELRGKKEGEEEEAPAGGKPAPFEKPAPPGATRLLKLQAPDKVGGMHTVAVKKADGTEEIHLFKNKDDADRTEAGMKLQGGKTKNGLTPQSWTFDDLRTRLAPLYPDATYHGDASLAGADLFAEDAAGHEHKGTGPGGGQFTGKGGGGGSGRDKPEGKPAAAPSLHRTLAAKMPALTEEQTDGLDEYLSGAHVGINRSLRAGTPLQPGDRGHRQLKHIESAVAAAPTLDKPVTVYRGLRLDGEKGRAFLAEAKEAARTGALLRDPAFVSTTIDPATAKAWATGGAGAEFPVVMEIAARKGLYLGESVGGAKEKEMLLQRGSKFKVLGVEDRGDHHVIKAEQHLEAPGPAGDPDTPPPPGRAFLPDVTADANGDGITDAARVGVPAMEVPPPPPVAVLPHLTPLERKAETEFKEAYEANPDHVAGAFLHLLTAATPAGQPMTFGTDDAKVLHAAWEHESLTLEQRSRNRATLNCALHQTANAVCKRAFLQHLDTLKPGDKIMVTVGGCGAGKGWSLKQVPEVLAMKQQSQAVWDSAGDQNATENPWIQREAEKRGLKVTYAYVHADPFKQWADPAMGVVKRAQDQKDGRMVDADVFADSYALGARNHAAFAEANRDNPNAHFVFLANGKRLEAMPQDALAVDRGRLRDFARKAVRESDAPAHIKRGATVGERIWGEAAPAAAFAEDAQGHQHKGKGKGGGQFTGGGGAGKSDKSSSPTGSSVDTPSPAGYNTGGVETPKPAEGGKMDVVQGKTWHEHEYQRLANETLIKPGGGSSPPLQSRATFAGIVFSTPPADSKAATRQARTALMNAIWGGLLADYAAGQLVSHGWGKDAVDAAMGHIGKVSLENAGDDLTSEGIAQQRAAVAKWQGGRP